jgi:carboxypeptidase family protein
MTVSHPVTRLVPLAGAAVFALAALFSTPAQAQQAAADVVRGHVRAANDAPLGGAAVTATARDRSTKSARSDAQGAYTLTFPAGSGPYTVAVTLIGFVAQTRQVPEPAAGTARPDVDFKLDATVQRLAAVTTRAVRQRAQRSDADRTGVGEVGRDNLAGGLGADLSGDIASAMATVPGLLITPDPNGGLPTISAFGLSGDQNSLTLNGMNFGAGSIPRDGVVLRVSQSTYDPGRGGFSGVQTMLRLPAGSNFVNQILHLTAEDPILQGSTPLTAQFGSQYSRQILSGAWSGPIVEDKAFYSTSFQFSRRASDLVSLASTNPASLQSLGISSDSVKRLIGLLGPLGIPVVTKAVPSDRLSTNASFLSRFDWAPNVSSRAGNVLYALVGGNYSDNAGTRGGPTAFASHGGDTKNWAAQVQVNSSRFVGSILNESNFAFVTAENRTTPYLFMPDARLLIASTFPDGTAGSSTVRVGGNSNAESNSRNSSVQLRNETSWFTMNSRHNFKVTLDGRVETDNATQNANRLGTYSYNSLADFAAGRPASFTRTLSSRETQGQQLLGAVGLGDIYRPYNALRVQYGVRLEGNAFGDRPEYNPLVQSLFGRSTDHVPSALTLAPMVGFTRQYTSHGGGAFTGGIREYVGTLSSQTVEGVLRQTGLPDAVQQLTCVGAAVPAPAWSSYATNPGAIPTQCADGSAGSPFSQSVPPVTVFAPGYDPSRRWGASMGWNGRVGSSWIGFVTANYSLNMHRPGAFDLNFNPAAKFALASEGNRPVYVSPTSIVAGTGAVASTDSRRYAQFAQVNELRADLRSDARQLIIGVASAQSDRPAGLKVTTSVRAYYTLSDNREQTRGFGGGTTDGDPTAVVWGESGLPRHSFQVLASLQIPGWFNLDAFARIASGRKYTPLVGGDINGDGLSNDRAFVFDPGSAPDPALASGMNALLAAAPRAARDCLSAQLRRVASRNSCDGPWTQSLNMAMSLDPRRFGLGDRGSISLVITNVLGAADQLLHGSNNLRYWGTSVTPDPTLLNVRGFDASTNRFKYDVNPLFGSTTASQSTGRLPFVIALDVRLRLGPDRDAQMLKGFLKPRPNDGTKALTADQIKERLDHDAQNNFEDVAKRKGSVQLTPAQVTALNAMAKKFDGYRDSVYTDLSKYLASLKGNYLTLDAKRRFHDDFVAIARQYVVAGPRVRILLTEEQFATLPVSMTAYFDMTEAEFDRLMKSADFGTLLELITGEGID